jgi:hypothetical protein
MTWWKARRTAEQGERAIDLIILGLEEPMSETNKS